MIQALRRNDISRAIEETWSLVSQLVGEPPENGEKLWNSGEAATLAASIMAVCYDNQDHPEYQNLTNVFYCLKLIEAYGTGMRKIIQGKARNAKYILNS